MFNWEVLPKLANLIKQAHGYKYHWAVADYLQRAARPLRVRPISIRPLHWAKPLLLLRCKERMR